MLCMRMHCVTCTDERHVHCAQADIARYLLNYMGRDARYTEKVRNCQAFAADFFSFAAGKKVQPALWCKTE